MTRTYAEWNQRQVPHRSIAGNRTTEHPTQCEDSAASLIAHHPPFRKPPEYFFDPFPFALVDMLVIRSFPGPRWINSEERETVGADEGHDNAGVCRRGTAAT